jgi:hypothetical protein
MWNETFNRSKNPLYFIPRLVWAATYELYLLVKGERSLLPDNANPQGFLVL